MPRDLLIQQETAMASHGAVSLLEVARTLRPRILAERDHIEAGRRLPEGLTRALAQAGLFRIFLPAAYGGLDLTPMEAMEVYEELARADASVAWCVWNGNVNWTTAQLPKDAAQTVFADPDMILANSTRPSGQAAVVDGGYRVSGRWSLVSGCQLSSWFILMCIVHENGTRAVSHSLCVSRCPGPRRDGVGCGQKRDRGAGRSRCRQTA